MRTATFVIGMVLGAVTLASAQGQEFRIRFNACPPGQTCAAADAFTVLDTQSVASGPARQRNPELSSDQIVVRAYDAAGTLVFTQLVNDPRVLRSEGAGPTGELTGQVLQRPSPEFLVSVPDDPPVAQLRLYHPRWTGSAFALDLLGTIAVN